MLNKYSGSLSIKLLYIYTSVKVPQAVHNYSSCFVRQLSFYASLLIQQQLLSYLLSSSLQQSSISVYLSMTRVSNRRNCSILGTW